MTTETTAHRLTTAPELLASQRLRIGLALLAVYVIWGTTYLGIRFALQSFPPYLLMGIRFLLAGGGLFVVLRLRGAALPTRRQWRNAALIGTLLLVGGMGSVALAEQSVASGLAATLVATMPLWTLLFGMLWRRFPTKSECIGVLIGLAGVIILTLEGNLQANPTGVLLMLFANASWSFGSVWMQHLDLPAGAMSNAAEMVTGGAILFVAGLLRGEQISLPVASSALIALLYLTTFGSLVTLTAYAYLLKTVSPALATSYTFVNPPIALFLGVLIAGETLTGSALIALPIILVGIAFIARPKH